MAEKSRERLLLEAQAKAKLMSMSQEPQTPDVSNAEVIGRAAQQGASGGFSDEAQPFAQKLIAKADLGIGQIRGALGDEEAERAATQRATATLQKPDEEIIQEARKDIAEADAANPGLFLGSEAIASIPAAVALGTAGLGPATIGAAVSGVQAAGEAEGSVLDRVDDVLLGTVVGGLTGGAVTGATAVLSKTGQVVGSAMREIASGLKELSRKLSTKAIKLRSTKGLDVKSIQRLADKLLDKNITSKPAFLRTVNKQLKQQAKSAGKAVRNVYKQVDDAAGPEDLPTKDELKAFVLEDLQKTATTADLPEQVAKQLDNFLEAGVRPDTFKPTDIIRLVGDIERKTKAFDQSVATAESINAKNALIEASRRLRSAVKQTAKKHFPKQAEAFQDSLETFALLQRVTGSIDDSLVQGFRASSSRLPAGSVTGEALRAVGDATISSTPVKTAAAGTFRAISQNLAKGGKGLGRFSSRLKKAAEKGPKSVAAVHFVLMQKEPEYQEIARRLFTGGEDGSSE